MTQQVNQQTENYVYVIVNSLFIFYFKYLIYKKTLVKKSTLNSIL